MGLLGDFGTQGASILTNGILWIGILVVFLVFTFGILVIKRQKKFTYPALILNDLGGGKIGVEKTKAGWFKSRKILFGLLDKTGERRLETKDKRLVQQGSTEDFHEIGHKRGLILMAKPDDPKILVPIKRMKIENKVLMTSIAPADYRDASSKIIKEAEHETKEGWEKIASIVLYGLLGIILLIVIILTIQYAKSQMNSANEIYERAVAFHERSIGSSNVVPSQTP